MDAVDAVDAVDTVTRSFDCGLRASTQDDMLGGEMAGSQFVVEVDGIEELMRRLDRAASSAVLRAAMGAACNLVQSRLAVYPAASHGKMPWKSEKQRRFVMAGIRDGTIEVPYRRTGTLGRRWTSSVSGEGLDVVGEVGNNTVYGPYVMDRHDQAMYHAGTWPLAQDVAEQAMGDVTEIFRDAVETALG